MALKPEVCGSRDLFVLENRIIQLFRGIFLISMPHKVNLTGVMYDSYLLKDVHSVLVNFPREYAQESMILYI